jgi:hypothetical protein
VIANLNNKNNHTLYEEIQVTLRLKKRIAFVGRLISYQEKKSFDEFVSEGIRQAILAIGSDHLNDNQPLKEYVLIAMIQLICLQNTLIVIVIRYFLKYDRD